MITDILICIVLFMQWHRINVLEKDLLGWVIALKKGSDAYRAKEGRNPPTLEDE